jgi:drug/metabolite transporter (DMT)-like permease
MFIGFWFWFRGLSLGGAARVGQVQLLQPFISILFGALLVAEPLTLDLLAFIATIMGCVVLAVKTRERSKSFKPPRAN